MPPIMAPKSQSASGADDQPNPASSTAKETLLEAGSSHNNKSTSHSTTPSTTAGQNTPANDAVSQPMTKSTSTGSNPSAKDNMSGPNPYGTRSRNRGQARPNYAEDKDMDIDMFDVDERKDEDHPKKSSRKIANGANGALDAPRNGDSTSRKAASPGESKTGNSHGTAKDHASGALGSSNAASSAASANSKKRKAQSQHSGGHGASAHSTGASTPTTSSVTSTRRSVANAVAASIASSSGFKESNMLTFEDCGAKPNKDGKLIADDGTVLQRNDHVYLVCEPPGEPYYLGRIMEFLHVKNDNTKPVDALRINWYYRPKDIGKKVNDTRLVFATMHQDISPLRTVRGKCQIRHKAEIENMDDYRKTPDCFWFEKLYDRYIQKNYDIIPCSQIVNVPERVKRVLDERWKYIIVEQGRSKELTSAVKLCKRCGGYCANNDSVDCAVCNKTYHMNCVRPPLLKKPTRGFAWACAACSRAQERRVEARNTPGLGDTLVEVEEEYPEDEEEDHVLDTTRTTPSDGIEDEHQPPTPEQIYHASLWPYRYLGIHCKPEDALDYDDRIYPRAGSRLGPKHQATVVPWYGRPVKLVKPLHIKKNGRKEGKPSKEVLAAIEKDKQDRERRPKWIQDEPPGYVHRGEDLDNDDPNCTAQLLYKPPSAVGAKTTPQEIDDYMKAARSMADKLGVRENSTNLQDVARDKLFTNDFNTDKALKALDKTEWPELKEPKLSASELKKFEEGVTKFGSELHFVTKHVKTMKHSDVVRFYYVWKHTERGKQIWGNYNGRKVKKEAKKVEIDNNKLQDDVADDQDDSAFDTDKAVERKRQFICKFCSTKTSRQWRRAPNVASALITEGGGKNKDKAAQYIVALCRRCAELWRRYAIQWEDMEELAKKVAAAGGRAWKRRVDEELLKELAAANDMMSNTVYSTPSTSQPGTARTASPANGLEHPRKKLKTITDKEAETYVSDSGSMSGVHVSKKKVEKPAPPPVPEMPKPRVLPCAICHQMSPTGEQNLLSCRECRLSVHRKCYGVMDNRHPGKWTCDMCLNDKSPQVSLDYKCVLCPVEYTQHDFVEPPKNSHKKKTEKEREKERVEREMAQKAADFYRKRQEDTNRPVNPREPLKRTADNNWVHVTCAVWTPEVKFGNAKALAPSEGIPSIPRARYDEVCKVCKQTGGACVPCHQCRSPVHIECANQAGYLLGFEVSPVKGSRRDQFNIVTIGGETGAMSAAIWCKEHIPTRTLVHRIQDMASPTDGTSMNALQLFAQNFKQADLALTGTVRKANLIAMATKAPAASQPTNGNRRASTMVGSGPGTETDSVNIQSGDKVCITCGIDVSPKWWPIEKEQENVFGNGHSADFGSEALKFMNQRNFQCHKCKKTGRKPVRHIPQPPPPPPPPAVESASHFDLRAPPASALAAVGVGALTSPPTSALAEPRAALARFPWASSIQTTPPPAAAPALAASPMQAPHTGPSAPMSLSASHSGPSPIAAPVTQHLPPPGAPYTSDWHRSVNGGPTGPNLIHHNHLRDLRPPPIAPITHHQPPILGGPPMLNGVPPTSPRRGNLMPNGTGPYLGSFHHSAQHSLPNLTNGGPPPRAGEPAFSSSLLGHRSPFSTPHGSPPIARDGLPMSRENSLPSREPVAPRQSDRPATGASASPSLRNLLL